jgi:hypothetical protein
MTEVSEESDGSRVPEESTESEAQRGELGDTESSRAIAVEATTSLSCESIQSFEDVLNRLCGGRLG